ncbi:MAG: hypothetical protein Q6366_008415 [Candidatus Freyarchaeota archaeon]
MTEPEVEVVVVPRWRQPLSGFCALILGLLVALFTWWIFADIRFSLGHFMFGWYPEVASLLGGWGLLVAVWQAWLDNYPYSKLKRSWAIGIAGTVLNIVVVWFMVYVVFYQLIGSLVPEASYPKLLMYGFPIETALYISSSATGMVTGATFSFGLLWVAGTMFWPLYHAKQPKRGLYSVLLALAIGLTAWYFLLLPPVSQMAQNSAAILTFMYLSELQPAMSTLYNIIIWYYTVSWFYLNTGALRMLNLTQWVIFFALLTMLTWEYEPWIRLKKQPLVGVVAFVCCTFLGVLFGLFLSQIVYTPPVPSSYLWFAMGQPLLAVIAEVAREGAKWTAPLVLAVFFIMAEFILYFYFDNWPKKYSKLVNITVRTVIVILAGLAMLYLYYMFSARIIGDPDILSMISYPILFLDPRGLTNPLPFQLWLLWVLLLHGYVWRKWPIWKPLT